jgi:hypothetical protein
MATFALAQQPLAQPAEAKGSDQRTPPKRTLTVLTDSTLVPEAR